MCAAAIPGHCHLTALPSHPHGDRPLRAQSCPWLARVHGMADTSARCDRSTSADPAPIAPQVRCNGIAHQDRHLLLVRGAKPDVEGGSQAACAVAGPGFGRHHSQYTIDAIEPWRKAAKAQQSPTDPFNEERRVSGYAANNRLGVTASRPSPLANPRHQPHLGTPSKTAALG